MPEPSGTAVHRRSLRPTVQQQTFPFRWVKSTARTTSPTRHVRPPGFCHCWPSAWNSPALCPQSELHPVTPERIWKWGHRSEAKCRKHFFGRAPPLFGSKSIISRFGERFRYGHYSLVSFLFAVLLLTVPPCPAICKSGGTCPRVLSSRRHWLYQSCFQAPVKEIFVCSVL